MTHGAEVVGGADMMSGEDSVTLGQALAVAREARGLTIGEVDSKLRLGKHYVAAFEEDRIGSIVAPVFVKGYLRHLARLYGLKYEDLLARFDRNTSLATAPTQPISSIDNRRNGRKVLRSGGWILAVAVSGYVIARMDGGSIVRYVEPVWDALQSVIEFIGDDAEEPETGESISPVEGSRPDAARAFALTVPRAR